MRVAALYRTVGGSIPPLEIVCLEVAQLVELSTVETRRVRAWGIGAVAAHRLRMSRVRISIILFSIFEKASLAQW